jgi:hypothetical protein
MLSELMYFLFIVIIFIFAYGVSTQSLMFHNQELNLDLIKNIFIPAYFVIGGEYMELDKLINGNETYIFIFLMTGFNNIYKNILSHYDKLIHVRQIAQNMIDIHKMVVQRSMEAKLA